VIHQGSPDRISIAFSADGRMSVLRRYVLQNYSDPELVTEIDKEEIGPSADGRFGDLAPHRRFLLSAVFEETRAPDAKMRGALYVYQAEEHAPAGSAFVIWRADPGTPPVEAEADAGVAPDGSWIARTDYGLGISFLDGTLTDTAGVKHALGLTFGPGTDGEATRLSGILPLGDIYDPHSATWTYLFAPAFLPVASGGSELFAARSFTLGVTTPNFEGSAGDAVSVGTLAKEVAATILGNPVTLSPGSLRIFDKDRSGAAGVLAKDARINWYQGQMSLAAGTVYGQPNPNAAGWAIPSKETSFAEKSATLKVPAGSTIHFSDWGIPKDVVPAIPIPLRVGGLSVSIAGATFTGTPSSSLTSVALSQPVAVQIGGKKIVLIDTLTFNENGTLESGRLQADTEQTVGGRVIRFLHGYDPEHRELGVIYLFPDGHVRGGSLAAAMAFTIGKSTVSASRGDSVLFGKDGRLEAFTPSTMVTVSAGDRRILYSDGTIAFNPDGSVAPGSLSLDLQQQIGAVSISTTTAVCTDTRVRVRALPNLQAETLGYLDKGDTLVVLGKGAQQMPIDEMTAFWYRVRRIADGLTGWSYGYFLRLKE
jgi:hypothetical protein